MYHQRLSVSGLSDSLRAPGISMLDTVQEHGMSSNSSSDVSDTETPPVEDFPAAMFSTEDEAAR